MELRPSVAFLDVVGQESKAVGGRGLVPGSPSSSI